MTRSDRDQPPVFEAQHAAIIARTLRWADEAAARHDYVEAVRWVETIRRLGDEVPEEYKAKLDSWLGAIDPARRARRG